MRPTDAGDPRTIECGRSPGGRITVRYRPGLRTKALQPQGNPPFARKPSAQAFQASLSARTGGLPRRTRCEDGAGVGRSWLAGCSWPDFSWVDFSWPDFSWVDWPSRGEPVTLARRCSVPRRADSDTTWRPLRARAMTCGPARRCPLRLMDHEQPRGGRRVVIGRRLGCATGGASGEGAGGGSGRGSGRRSGGTAGGTAGGAVRRAPHDQVGAALHDHAGDLLVAAWGSATRLPTAPRGVPT
jgi:hypothetical protein